MRNKLLGLAVGGMALLFCGTANAVPTTLGLDFLGEPDVANAWFFNFTRKNNHHIASDDNGTQSTNTDFDAFVGEGGLDYISPIGGDPLIGLTVRGFTGLNIVGAGAGTVSGNISGIEERVRHDFGGTNNGIGVMSTIENGNTSVEQVNSATGQGAYDEFLLLDFSETVNLLGLDFTNGNHSLNCGASSCGLVDIYALNGAGTAFTLVTSGDLSVDDYLTFGAGFSSQQFILAAAGPAGSGGEQGWYLEGIAGNVSAVPLPASILFLLAGLTGLGMTRARRKA